jgi:hypothetical protein
MRIYRPGVLWECLQHGRALAAPRLKLRLVTVSQGRTTPPGPPPILRTWLRARRPKLRLTTEPEPKLRIYRHVTAETESRDDESEPNCAARAS